MSWAARAANTVDSQRSRRSCSSAWKRSTFEGASSSRRRTSASMPETSAEASAAGDTTIASTGAARKVSRSNVGNIGAPRY